LAETAGLRELGKRRRTEQILAATRDLLREGPERPLAVERIAERAQVAPATVFNLVGTREQIWAALMDQATAAAQTRIDALPDLEPRERADRVVTEYVRAITSDAAVNRIALAHWAESGRLLRRDGTRDLVESLESAQAAGALRADADVGELGALVATGCTGALHQWAAGMIGNALLLKRCRAMVDLAFAAGA
jgi:AcrR family transcriptional regulator